MVIFRAVSMVRLFLSTNEMRAFLQVRDCRRI